jgi:hypothetical protein
LNIHKEDKTRIQILTGQLAGQDVKYLIIFKPKGFINAILGY